MKSIYCSVRTGSLNKTVCHSSLKCYLARSNLHRSLVSQFAGYLGSTHISLLLQIGTQLYDRVSGEMKGTENNRTPSQNKWLILHTNTSDWPSLQTILFRNQWNRLYNGLILSAGKVLVWQHSYCRIRDIRMCNSSHVRNDDGALIAEEARLLCIPSLRGWS